MMFQLAYASSRQASLPHDVERSLPRDTWHIDTLSWDRLKGLSTLPNIVWLDLGAHVTEESAPWAVIYHLADLQPARKSPVMIFISGSVPGSLEHRRIADRVFSCFSSPETVEIDLKGEPDVQSAVSKYSVLWRRYSEASLQKQPLVRPPAATELPDADLRDASGNLSAKKIAELFNITAAELGRWIDRKKAAISKSPSAPSLQPLLTPYANIARIRSELGSDVNFRKWLRTAHPLLENKSPLHWLGQGKATEIADFVHDALTGRPT